MCIYIEMCQLTHLYVNTHCFLQDFLLEGNLFRKGNILLHVHACRGIWGNADPPEYLYEKNCPEIGFWQLTGTVHVYVIPPPLLPHPPPPPPSLRPTLLIVMPKLPSSPVWRAGNTRAPPGDSPPAPAACTTQA